MKTYQSFEEISRDLKLLSLERQIALEELKMVKNDFEESLKPLSMIKNILTTFGKFGTLMLIKRVFK
ncbi:DUF6327 family protein [Polaribacter glomeratus]|uniref:Glutaminyl-tRNA synthetase n=1 Tax=Polaribacter glomeratus TaxID=102 RepID=A0A2S7WIM5_9FLAO|nr:DUF6327 family protein [Polaribacter glomeratus]PQJ77450.1 hypothetical protein BTO16_16635 [Polaribacter glomeratus]TXD66038.1 hypothetical protein ESX12_07730 [Polaribacter glomeratus]